MFMNLTKVAFVPCHDFRSTGEENAEPEESEAAGEILPLVLHRAVAFHRSTVRDSPIVQEVTPSCWCFFRATFMLPWCHLCASLVLLHHYFGTAFALLCCPS